MTASSSTPPPRPACSVLGNGRHGGSRGRRQPGCPPRADLGARENRCHGVEDGARTEGGGMTTDDSYPSSWTPRGLQRQTGPSADVIEALLLAIDSYIASLPDNELRAL